MNRRGFLARLGVVTGAAVAAVKGPLPAAPVAPEPAVVDVETINFRPVPHPDIGRPTFREAYEAARRGEIWSDGRFAAVTLPKDDDE